MKDRFKSYSFKHHISFVAGMFFYFIFSIMPYDLINRNDLRRKPKSSSIAIATADLVHAREKNNNFSVACAPPILIPDVSMKTELFRWRKLAGQLQCRLDPNSVGITGGWCLQPNHEDWGSMKGAQNHVPADTGIAKTIVKYLRQYHDIIDHKEKKVSLLDIGAGIGQYGHWLQLNASNDWIEWRGYDGAENVEEFTNGYVQWLDVTNPLFDTISNDFRADWVMSLEVGEHIPPESTASMLNLLDKHSKHGIILSWGIPGQGGHSHINLKTNDEVVALMKQQGFMQDGWCQEFQAHGRKYADYPWFWGSFMVFRRV